MIIIITCSIIQIIIYIIDDDIRKTITMLKPFGETLVFETIEGDDVGEERVEDDKLDVIEEGINSVDGIIADTTVDAQDNDELHNMLGNFKFASHVDINGAMVHKSNAVNSILNSKTRISRDRLLRVRGLSEEIIEPSHQDSESLICVTDTLITFAKLKPETIGVVILCIQKIKYKSFFVDSIQVDNINEVEFHGTLIKLSNFDEKHLYWNGVYGESIVSKGEYCLSLVSNAITHDEGVKTVFLMESVNSAIEIITTIYKRNLADSTTIYSHLKSLKSPYCNQQVLDLLTIHDLKVNNTKSSKQNCNICAKLVPIERMRQHIGKHLVKLEINPNQKTCGFCGCIGCSVELKKSGIGKKAVNIVASDCKYFLKYNLAASKKSTTYSPCTNHPDNCSICKNVYWTYNMEEHYKFSHPSVTSPFLLSDDEKKKVVNLLI